MQGQYVMCKQKWKNTHAGSGTLVGSCHCQQFRLNSCFHAQPLHKTNSAVSHLAFCNLQITSNYKQCEREKSAYWGETKFCPYQGSGCTITAGTLSVW